MRRWLLKLDDEITEPVEEPVLTDEEAICSPKGQVMLMPGQRSVLQINAEKEAKFAVLRREIWSKAPVQALAKVRELAGIARLGEIPEAKLRRVGTVERAGYRIEKLVLEPTASIQLPALAFIPPKPDGNAYLYLNGRGMQTDAAAGGPIEQLAKQGHVVLAVDLRGVGETENLKRRYGGVFTATAGEYFLTYLLGKSLVGMWTEDVLSCGRFLAQFESAGAPRKVHLVATGHVGIPALHAAALEPQLFATTKLRGTLASWAEIVPTPKAGPHLITTVHGALKHYDLPDLVKSCGPERVTIEEPLHP
jgi:hypothetical protein